MSNRSRPSDAQDVIDPDLLMLAYRSGIFPMAESRDDPSVVWIEPRERAIIPLDGLHVSRSLKKVLKSGRFHVTCNAAFAEVVEACAAPRRPTMQEDGIDDGSESWISHRIAASYRLLHSLGRAHSIEVWQQGDGGPVMVGGLYGVGFARAFCGESMFSTASDASKVALCYLVAAMRASRLELLDCQFMTGHLGRMGAVAMPQSEYLELLAKAMRPSSLAPFSTLPEGFHSLIEGSSSPGKVIAQSFTQTS
ncbi:leucyl/phenylalanyl-tRNA--protein transferase [Croceicoccus mobilis]|uniref:Leucyl/phenylalanyl-tRNA--protein transferase n=1 Tax=Croceicoccus mobilis TaxID=1703339 RepID=A0A916Z143_9SPHN|nr:leucyl/phenylalanyl-tRNA--protein transferase [Croceicoccus mobilis]GGD70592.1 leucyl/phenylalanyl-tRNA--protein transferase [Croceicoccus mobilis]